jgi:hypothetical protein
LETWAGSSESVTQETILVLHTQIFTVKLTTRAQGPNTHSTTLITIYLLNENVL